jgi:hypothetical protein
MTDVGMENDSMGHVHVWERKMGACVCGAKVPSWLQAAWNRHAEKKPASS